MHCPFCVPSPGETKNAGTSSSVTVSCSCVFLLSSKLTEMYALNESGCVPAGTMKEISRRTEPGCTWPIAHVMTDPAPDAVAVQPAGSVNAVGGSGKGASPPFALIVATTWFTVLGPGFVKCAAMKPWFTPSCFSVSTCGKTWTLADGPKTLPALPRLATTTAATIAAENATAAAT